MQKLIVVKGTEWMKKLLDGERDFGRVKIIGEEEVLRNMDAINEYLMLADLEQHPLVFDNSDLTGVKAPGIYAPHTRARGVRAPYADFSGAFLEHSDMGPYIYPNGTGTASNLVYVTFDNAKMQYAIIKNALVGGMSVYKTDLSYADIRGVRDLDRVESLGRADTYGAVMDEEQDRIVKVAKSHRISDV